MSDEPSRKRQKTFDYEFRTNWEEEYFFTKVKSNFVCLVCNFKIGHDAKKKSIAKHYLKFHPNYEDEFPIHSDLRRVRVAELNSIIRDQPFIFTRPNSNSKAATIAALRVSHVISKRKSPFEDGEMIKEAFLEAAGSLFDNYIYKSKILSAIRGVELSSGTVLQHAAAIGNDLIRQMNNDIAECVCFSLQFVESIYVVDALQLCIFIRFVFKDLTAKEELLKILPLKKEDIRGEGIYHTFKDYIQESGLPINKLVSITTNGGEAMIDSETGFITLCKNDNAFPNFLSYHCIIHDQDLCGKMLNMEEVMNIALKIVNSNRARGLQCRLFNNQMDENKSEHMADDLLLADLRWLSRGDFIQRFKGSLPEIKEFLNLMGEDCKQVEDEAWLLDLAFLADITAKLNELNVVLQDKDKTIVEMLSFVNFFKQRLNLLSSQLQRQELKNFTNMMSELQSRGKTQEDLHNQALYVENINHIIMELDRRFQEFIILEPVATFMCFPFCATVDIEVISSQLGALFHMNTSSIENEILALQSDLQMKSRSSEDKFWRLIMEKKYPNLRRVAIYLTAFFGSTSLCESAFLNIKTIKSKYRSTLTEDHLDACLRQAVTTYTPNFEQLADSKQCKTMIN